jgi:hypothetical protein
VPRLDRSSIEINRAAYRSFERHPSTDEAREARLRSTSENIDGSVLAKP